VTYCPSVAYEGLISNTTPLLKCYLPYGVMIPGYTYTVCGHTDELPESEGVSRGACHQLPRREAVKEREVLMQASEVSVVTGRLALARYTKLQLTTASGSSLGSMRNNGVGRTYARLQSVTASTA
jgi:hypothetical protein